MKKAQRKIYEKFKLFMNCGAFNLSTIWTLMLLGPNLNNILLQVKKIVQIEQEQEIYLKIGKQTKQILNNQEIFIQVSLQNMITRQTAEFYRKASAKYQLKNSQRKISVFCLNLCS